MARSRNMQVLTDQVRQKHPGVVIYGIGDEAHKGSASGHNEDDTPGSKPEDQDADSKPEHRAIDVMIGPKFTRTDAMLLVTALVTRPENQRRLLYVIFDRKIWRRNGGWRQETYTGKDPHTNHPHVSGEADDDENTARWSLDPLPTPDKPAATQTVKTGRTMFAVAQTEATGGSVYLLERGVDADGNVVGAVTPVNNENHVWALIALGANNAKARAYYGHPNAKPFKDEAEMRAVVALGVQPTA